MQEAAKEAAQTAAGQAATAAGGTAQQVTTAKEGAVQTGSSVANIVTTAPAEAPPPKPFDVVRTSIATIAQAQIFIPPEIITRPLDAAR